MMHLSKSPSTMTLASLLLALLLLLGCAATTGYAGPLEYKVELVQFMHRHGARSPFMPDDYKHLCDGPYPCGELNDAGKRMLTNVGKYLRERYTNDRNVVETPLLTTTNYSLAVVYSRSTDVQRTLQSSAALLRGLFPDMDGYYPAIHSVNADTDLLLSTFAAPASRMRGKFGKDEETKVCNEAVDKKLSMDSLLAVAEEVKLTLYCKDRNNRCACSITLCDVYKAYRATGKLDEPQYTKLSTTKFLCEGEAASTKYKVMYDRKNPVHQKQGAVGQTLLTRFLSEMSDFNERKGSPKFIEYSTHDSTVSAFASALGDDSYETKLPPFASTFIFELLSSTSIRNTEKYVRVLRGHPEFRPKDNYKFVLSKELFQLRCVDKDDKEYTATDSICPLSDLKRYVNRSAPTDPAGLCYIDPPLLERMNCPMDAEINNDVLSDECKWYRRQCPDYACNPGYTLNAGDLGCYRYGKNANDGADKKKGGGLAGGWVALIAILTLLVGAAIGFAAPYIVTAVKKRKGINNSDNYVYTA